MGRCAEHGGLDLALVSGLLPGFKCELDFGRYLTAGAFGYAESGLSRLRKKHNRESVEIDFLRLGAAWRLRLLWVICSKYLPKWGLGLPLAVGLVEVQRVRYS